MPKLVPIENYQEQQEQVKATGSRLVPIEQYGGPSTEQGPDMIEQGLRSLANMGRSTVRGMTALPSLAAEAVAYPLNKATGAINSAFGTNIPRSEPMALANNAIDSGFGVKPENMQERLTDDVISSIGGAGAMAKGGQVLAKNAGPVAKRVGESLAANQGAQAVSAAGAGLAGGGARESGAPWWGQFLASLAGGVGGAATAATAQKLLAGMKGNVSGAEGELMALSKKHDVPLTYTDTTGKWSKIDANMERVPLIGTSDFRAGQQDKAAQAAKSLSAKYGQGGEPAAQQVQTSISTMADKNTAFASKLYDKVAKMADPKGVIPPSKSLLAIDDAITKESAKVEPNNALISRLESMKSGIADRPQNFSGLRDWRSDIGADIRDYYKGSNAVIGEKGVGTLQSVRNAVDQDMTEFAKKQGGNLYESWKGADKFYKEKVVDIYRDATVSKVAKETDPTAIYKMVNSAVNAKPNTLYEAMGPKGRAGYRSMLVDDALSKAFDANGKDFSPAKFATMLEKHANQSGVFFKGADKAELDGIAKLMRHAERAGYAQSNPINGSLAIPYMAGGASVAGAATSPIATAGVVIAGLGFRQMITTKAGKSFLIAFGQAKTPKAKDMVINNYMPQLAKIASSENQGSGDNDGDR